MSQWIQFLGLNKILVFSTFKVLDLSKIQPHQSVVCIPVHPSEYAKVWVFPKLVVIFVFGPLVHDNRSCAYPDPTEHLWCTLFKKYAVCPGLMFYVQNMVKALNKIAICSTILFHCRVVS